MKRTASIFALGLAGLIASAPGAWAYTVYISNEKDNTVTVIDSEKLEVTATIKTGNRPRGITVTKDGKFILLCASDNDTVEVIDTATKQIVGTLPSGADPELFILSPAGNLLYIANENDNLVTVVDINAKKVVTEIPVGFMAWTSAAEGRRTFSTISAPMSASAADGTICAPASWRA